MLDGLGAEGGEQWLIHRTQAPGGENGHQQFGGARQQAGNPVARAYALILEGIGETAGQGLQLLETEAFAVAVAIFPDQGCLALAHMAITAFDTGIEAFEVALQRRAHGIGIGERTDGLGVIAHRQTPGFLLLESHHRSDDGHAKAARGQWPKRSIWMSGLAAGPARDASRHQVPWRCLASASRVNSRHSSCSALSRSALSASQLLTYASVVNCSACASSASPRASNAVLIAANG
ncbi:hypothetical protein D3C76_1001220 [compost metagenome]